MTSKRILIFGGVILIALLGLLTGYLVSSPSNQNPSGNMSVSELDQLKMDLTTYIEAKLKEEKKDSKVINISVLSPIQNPEGTVKFPYTVSYTMPVDGRESTSLVEATAILQKTANDWRVTKVTTERETITYGEDAPITNGKDAEANADTKSDTGTQAPADKGSD